MTLGVTREDPSANLCLRSEGPGLIRGAVVNWRSVARRTSVAVAASIGLVFISAGPVQAIEGGSIVYPPNLGFVGRLVNAEGDLCTATLTAPSKAMTAEHCLWDSDLTKLTITFGMWNTNDGGGQEAHIVDYEISEIDYRGPRDSIAVVTLDREITGVAPARVAGPGAPNTLYAKGERVLAAGWGTILPGDRVVSAELRAGYMDVADPTSTINSGAIRVEDIGGGHPQHGDSGGPLMATDQEGFIVVGVYTGSGADQHFYMKTTREDMLSQL